MPIRVAACGVGHWHALYDAAYLLHLQRMPDVQLVAVHDPDPDLAARRAAAVGDPPVYADYRRMVDDTRPDFVLALGRPTTMAETAHFLLDRGLPFLMEKPMGFDADQVREIAERAAALRAFVAVPLHYRYQPHVQQAREMIAHGRFGRLSHVLFRLLRPTSARYPAWGAGWMLDPAVANGGCLRNLGPHGLDAFCYLLQEEVEVTGAQLSDRALGEAVEDYATVSLRSRSGVLGTIEVGNLYPGDGGESELSVSGQDALLIARGASTRVVTAAGEDVRAAQLAEPGAYLVLRETLDRWQRGEPPPMDAQDCYRAIKLVDDAYALSRHA